MTKKLIPFDYATYQSGVRAVFRDYEIKEILDIRYYPQSKSEYKIVVIWLNSCGELAQGNFTEKGDYFTPNENNKDKDLMLEIEVKVEQPEENWVNLYVESDGTIGEGKIYSSKDEAANNIHDHKICLGQFRVGLKS